MRSLLVVLSLLFTFSAFAGFMAEPTVSVTSGSITGTSSTGTTLTPTNTQGLAGSMRLAYRGTSAWMGLEFGTSMGTGDDGSATYQMSETNYGVILGYDFTKYRINFSYLPSAEVKQTKDSSTMSYKGSAMKFGFGYFFKPRWSFNIEIMSHTFTKVSSGAAELDVSQVFNSLENRVFLITFAYML